MRERDALGFSARLAKEACCLRQTGEPLVLRRADRFLLEAAKKALVSWHPGILPGLKPSFFFRTKSSAVLAPHTPYVLAQGDILSLSHFPSLCQASSAVAVPDSWQEILGKSMDDSHLPRSLVTISSSPSVLLGCIQFRVLHSVSVRQESYRMAAPLRETSIFRY